MKHMIVTVEKQERLDKYLMQTLSVPMSYVRKLLRKKQVRVNGKKELETFLVKSNDVITLFVQEEGLEKPNIAKPKSTFSYHFDILYEDENLLAVNKPIGLLTVPDDDKKSNSLYEEVITYFTNKGLNDPNGAFIPHPAHRLDRNTSGVVLIGKNESTQTALEAMFQARVGIEKHYLGLVVGTVEKDGIIQKKLKKDAQNKMVKVSKFGQNATTKYNIIEKFKNDFTLLEFILITGKTHQIRVHASSVGYPLVGDRKYGNFTINHQFKKEYHWEDQFLHAYKIKFYSISGNLSYLNELEITAPIPEKMQTILEKLRKNS